MSSTKQIWFFTGGKGAGKSTAACRFTKPSEIGKVVVFDTEDSMSDILEQNRKLGVEFGAYIRAYDRFRLTGDMLSSIAKGKLPWVTEAQKSALLQYWEWFVGALDATLKPEHRYLVIDTIEPVEAAATAWVETNKRQAGWSGAWDFGKREIEGVRPLLEGVFEAIHRRGVTDIFLTAHIKNPWAEYAPGKSKPILDRVEPGGRVKLWSRLTTAMFWLVRPAHPQNPAGAPSAIVLKARRGEESITADDEWNTQSLIPPRIPWFDARHWRQYAEQGWDPMQPKEGESLLPDEKRMLAELLSDNEYKLMIMGAELALRDQEKAEPPMFAQQGEFKPPTVEAPASKARELAAQGKSADKIAAELGLPLPVVMAELGGGK